MTVGSETSARRQLSCRFGLGQSLRRALTACVQHSTDTTAAPAMSAHAPRLSRLFTPTYAAHINAQIVYPAQSQLLEPEKLVSVLSQPLHAAAASEAGKPATALAAVMSYAFIQGRPFLDGNKRTAFFLANEYIRAHGLPGIADDRKLGKAYQELHQLVGRFEE